MVKKKLLRLIIRIRGNDRYRGKPIVDQLLQFFKDNSIAGVTVYRGIHGYGARGIATMKVLGLSLDLPLIIESVDEHAKLEPLLPDIKKIVGDNGLITLDDVYVI